MHLTYRRINHQYIRRVNSYATPYASLGWPQSCGALTVKARPPLLLNQVREEPSRLLGLWLRGKQHFQRWSEPRSAVNVICTILRSVLQLDSRTQRREALRRWLTDACDLKKVSDDTRLSGCRFDVRTHTDSSVFPWNLVLIFSFSYTAAKYLTRGRCICLTCLQDCHCILSFYASPAAFGKINKGLWETSVSFRGRARAERYYRSRLWKIEF